MSESKDPKDRTVLIGALLIGVAVCAILVLGMKMF